MNLFVRVSAKLLALILTIGFIVRILLVCITPGSMDIGFGRWMAVFALGFVNDLCIGVLSLFFMWLYLLSIGRWKYGRVPGGIILALLSVIFIYVLCFNTVFDEYGSVVPTIAKCIFGYWAIGFAIRYFIPSVRNPWMKTWFWIISGLYVLIIYFNAAGEYFFWDEFNVRYNFIAVDYLIYTHEVIGNIMESYAMVPLMLCVLTVSGITTWFMFRKDVRHLDSFLTSSWRLKAAILYPAVSVASVWVLSCTVNLQNSDNLYYNELQANGVYKFFDAFTKNHLDYKQFYYTLEDDEVERSISVLYGNSGPHNSHLVVADSIGIFEEGCRPNIVLITMESMSASFMERYGDERHITPSLDSLAKRSLTFDRLIATGNRTVRGLEALSLSLPPSPGESLIKRPDCTGLRTVGVVLGELGYKPVFLYGGNSYFDNMGTYFGGNGYEVIDINDYAPGEITFSNIWGVADENAYDKLLSVLDKGTVDTPVFAHMMTISNHRPYTYPAGRISIPNDSKSRAGGVMYADYALGRFIEMAHERPWFDNTVFVIVADHCASSAGKVELPVDKYHIPAMIYAPGKIEPVAVETLCSQIDLMPTLFALIGLEYESNFFGKNILASDYTPRAFLATYENLGYLENDTLTVLSPVRRIEQFECKSVPGNQFNTEPIETIDSVHAKKATAFYQTTSTWYSPER